MAMKFASSRTFRRQGWFVKSSIVGGRSASHLPQEFRYKIVHEQRYVLAPFPKWRDYNRDGVEVIDQILAEFSLANHL
jgi:hypothetical protein